MTEGNVTLHLLVGKVCSGKSTLASKLGQAPKTVVIAEDDWLSTLYGEEMSSLRDYVRYSTRLRMIMEHHIITLLGSGLSVILDFAANTRETRVWMRRLFEAAGCNHKLHYLENSDEECKRRLQIRNSEGKHPFSVDEIQFELITSYFEPPTAKEGFEITVYSQRN